MRAYRAGNGKVLWFKPDYVGPAMIHGDMILKDKQRLRPADRRAGDCATDPLTGAAQEWTWTRSYGCNTPLASENLLTFRSGAAGYFDLCNDGGTGNFGGFRSSCTNNLIVADGLITAPDYTRGCTCSYQNQTSVALVPMADAEMWTYYGVARGQGRRAARRHQPGRTGQPQGRARHALARISLGRRPVAAPADHDRPRQAGIFPPSSIRKYPAKVRLGRRSGMRGLEFLTITLAKDATVPLYTSACTSWNPTR